MFSPEQKRILEMLEVESKGDQAFMRQAQDILLKACAYHVEAAVRFKATRNADGGLVLKRKEDTHG